MLRGLLCLMAANVADTQPRGAQPMPEPIAAILGIAGPVLDAAEARLFAAHPPAGVILFGRNLRDPDQLRALIASLRAVLPPDAVLMVDQEGGRVARLRPPHWRAHPPAAAIGRLFAIDAAAGLRAAWLTGALIGLDAAAAGFDVVCAPVLDLLHPGASDVVGDRSYGAAPAAVGRLGRAVAAGLLAAGVQPVGKHAPGHGQARADSHHALPVIEGDMERDLAPFVANADLPWLMTAHILFPAWDPDHPATQSPAILGDIVRGRIGFSGVLCSDDLAMQALQGGPADRARAALDAGCDLALFCAADPDANAQVLRACPPLSRQAARRLADARALAERRRLRLDPTALAAERDGLFL